MSRMTVVEWWCGEALKTGTLEVSKREVRFQGRVEKDPFNNARLVGFILREFQPKDLFEMGFREGDVENTLLQEWAYDLFNQEIDDRESGRGW